MTNTQQEIFQTFREAVTNKINPYFLNLGFDVELPFKEESQGITKSFTKQNQEVIFSISLHHLDYADGIQIQFKSGFGVKHLRTEAQKHSKTEIPIYQYSVNIVDDEMDRILKNFKDNLEKYIT